MATKLSAKFHTAATAVVFHGDCLDLLASIPSRSVQLVVTSPPYNIGKEYEKKVDLETYLQQQSRVITECARVVADTGSICWQVGNYVDNGAVVPLDAVLFPLFQRLDMVMRNRIVWHFEHGLHCSKRFSGRYETISWFTRKNKNYVFNLDPVRVPQKYPAKKYFKGPKAGQFSCHPLGKNPGDIWDIPNVKSNHIEKTAHPCQYPVGLIERLVLALTNEGDWVVDPFLGAGTSIVSAILNRRKGAGAEIKAQYVDLARDRISAAIDGTLKTRPMNQPKYDPSLNNNKLAVSPWSGKENAGQSTLFKNQKAVANENS